MFAGFRLKSPGIRPAVLAGITSSEEWFLLALAAAWLVAAAVSCMSS